jgi:hypothetical protein
MSERLHCCYAARSEAQSEAKSDSAFHASSVEGRAFTSPSLYIRLQQTKKLHTPFDLHKHPPTLEKILH